MVMCSGNVAMAQAYQSSRYYNNESQRLDYTNFKKTDVYENQYFGFRIGPAFTSVSSDDDRLDGSSTQTGLNLGFVYAQQLTVDYPLFLETGLSYIEKGGEGKINGSKFEYNLNYLELPFVCKYICDVDGSFTVQPYFGGYFALGVGGKMKDFGTRETYSSFGSDSNQFQRFDGGLKMGCGFGYDLFYGEIGYELGLSNICHSDFDDSSNSAFTLTFGVNF